MTKPACVLVSDVHYDLDTLELADAATRMAIDKANSLKVPLVVAGDLHNSKANLRGECVNAMLETFKLADQTPYIIIGNHDRLNEKHPAHALNFLAEFATLIDRPLRINDLNVTMLPYFHDPKELESYIVIMRPNTTLIMHQGVTHATADSGEYYQDKSAVPSYLLSRFRTISGHYHARQTINCGQVDANSFIGLFDYIGNPYTLNFGEAKHPEKGFQVLYDDGSLQFVPTNLRKHVVYEINAKDIDKS